MCTIWKVCSMSKREKNSNNHQLWVNVILCHKISILHKIYMKFRFYPPSTVFNIFHYYIIFSIKCMWKNKNAPHIHPQWNVNSNSLHFPFCPPLPNKAIVSLLFLVSWRLIELTASGTHHVDDEKLAREGGSNFLIRSIWWNLIKSWRSRILHRRWVLC